MGGKLVKLGEYIESKHRKSRGSETGHDPAIHGSKLQDRFYNNDAFTSTQYQTGDPVKQEAATKIQTQYRQHAATKEVESMREEEAALKIQAGVRGYMDRQKVRKMKDPEEYEKRHKAVLEKQQTPEVDIDLNDPEVENAAVKIQAGFKGYKTRKEMKDKEQGDGPHSQQGVELDVNLDDPEVEAAAVKIQSHFKGYKTRKEMQEATPKQDDQSAEQDDKAEQEDTVAQKEEEVIDIDLNDPEVEKAAEKIQAGFKGFKARKEVQALRQHEQEAQALVEEVQPDAEPEEIDIDLNDPEVEKAAVKIQATFKGYHTRKEMQEHKGHEHDEQPETKGEGEEKTDQPADDKTEEQTDGQAKPTQQEEEIDIDLNDPDTEKAAVMIQSSFRGYKSRKEMDAKKEGHPDQTADEVVQQPQEEVIDIDLNDPEVEKAAVKIQASFKGYHTRKEMQEHKEHEHETADEVVQQPQEEVIDIDLNDPEVEKAAVKIQASFKGYHTRKEMQEHKEHEHEAQPEEKGDEVVQQPQEEVIDIDLNDPEVEKAAVKIQASFKGYHTRKEMQEHKEHEHEAQPGETADEVVQQPQEEVIDIDLNDPEVEKAAVKIQASFKGYHTRKEMQEHKEHEHEVHPDEKGDVVVQKPQEEEIDIDLNDPEVEKAAVKIQATFKGYHTRKEMQEHKEHEHETAPEEGAETEAAGSSEVKEEVKKEEEEVDIDLNDPEVEKAAIKIQSGFKGYKVRRELKDKTEEGGEQKDGEQEGGEQEAGAQQEEEKKAEETTEQEGEKEEIDIDLTDPEVEKAAVKIQASFKGFKARKEVQEIKEEKADGEKKEEGESKPEEGEGQTTTQEEEKPADETGEQ